MYVCVDNYVINSKVNIVFKKKELASEFEAYKNSEVEFFFFFFKLEI